MMQLSAVHTLLHKYESYHLALYCLSLNTSPGKQRHTFYLQKERRVSSIHWRVHYHQVIK